jgi:histidyl-tRNA synthetase
VRGLDYYNKTVFEWISNSLGSQNAVCGGGRYDGLVEHLGGRATPGIGFAMGMERLIAMVGELGYAGLAQQPQVYLVTSGDAAERHGFALAEQLRNHLPQLRLQLNCGGGSFKSQFKRADQSGARYALILGDDEIAGACIAVKSLREDIQQQHLSEAELVDFLSNAFLSEQLAIRNN